ncbi:MAG: hypothetical protein HQL78_00260 [Magnetococcales bacterium]|nr:hypothetical protein [Magnetococcales bacterium]MBF0418581.1 hypothetical protein [Magnetococcales bacterium]
MIDIFERLNNEHIEIIDKYWSAFSFGLSSSEGQDVLGKARSAFFRHVFREEQELCRILLAAAEKNAHIALELSRINEDVLALTRVIIDSFSEVMASYNAETRYYYRQIMYAILNRVSLEEKSLLQKYTHLISLFANSTSH